MYISLLGLLLGVAILAVGYGKGRQRRRRRSFIIVGWIVIGVQVILLLVGPILFLWGNIKWVAYKPTSWLFSEIESSSTWNWPSESYRELVRRLEIGELDVNEIERFVHVAVSKYSEYIEDDESIFPEEIRAINNLYKMGKLSSEQEHFFFGRLVHTKIQVKPVGLLGDVVPVRIDITTHGDWSESEIWCAIQIVPQPSLEEQASGNTIMPWSTPTVRMGSRLSIYGDEIDAKLTPLPDGPLIMQGPQFVIWHAKAKVDDTVGKQGITCNVKMDFYDTKPVGDSVLNPIYTKDEILTGTFGATSDKSRVDIALIKDPELRPMVPYPSMFELACLDNRWCITVYHFNVVPRPTGHRLRIPVYIDHAHIGCAFDAELEADGTKHKAGTICHAKGQTWTWILEAPYPSSGPRMVNLKLIPNAELASESPDMPEIWGNTIEIKDIPRNDPIILKAAEDTFP